MSTDIFKNTDCIHNILKGYSSSHDPLSLDISQDVKTFDVMHDHAILRKSWNQTCVGGGGGGGYLTLNYWCSLRVVSVHFIER